MAASNVETTSSQGAAVSVNIYTGTQATQSGVVPQSHNHLPCGGIGSGWFLFLIGFLLGGIPWYLGALVLLFSRVDKRERAGYAACTIVAILFTIAVVLAAVERELQRFRS